jgi:hypothetical protein
MTYIRLVEDALTLTNFIIQSSSSLLNSLISFSVEIILLNKVFLLLLSQQQTIIISSLMMICPMLFLL